MYTRKVSKFNSERHLITADLGSLRYHVRHGGTGNQNLFYTSVLDCLHHMDCCCYFMLQHASEIIPFPNEETEFILPMSDFGDFFKKDTEKKEDDKPTKSRDSSGDERDSGHCMLRIHFCGFLIV